MSVVAMTTPLKTNCECLPGVYVELVDAAGHDFGPDSDEVKMVTKQVDAVLSYV